MKLLLLLAFFPSTLAILDQAYAVKGRLLCGVDPAANVRVKLWEEDTGPDPDDLLDSGYTDSNGEFRLGGSTAELTPIDPVFKIYHDCDDGMKPGKRKVKFFLPKQYITKGTVSKKEFDIGILNLETIFPKEERELIVTRRRRGNHRDYEDDPDDNVEPKERNRREGYNADYMDPGNIRDEPLAENELIVPRPTERPGRNPCN